MREVIDVTWPSDSPDKTEIQFEERKNETENMVDNKEDETAHQEHEKQVDDNNNNEGMKTQQNRKEKLTAIERRKLLESESPRDYKHKLKHLSFLFLLKGDCHPARMDKFRTIDVYIN